MGSLSPWAPPELGWFQAERLCAPAPRPAARSLPGRDQLSSVEAKPLFPGQRSPRRSLRGGRRCRRLRAEPAGEARSPRAACPWPRGKDGWGGAEGEGGAFRQPAALHTVAQPWSLAAASCREGGAFSFVQRGLTPGRSGVPSLGCTLCVPHPQGITSQRERGPERLRPASRVQGGETSLPLFCKRGTWGADRAMDTPPGS